MHQTIVRIVALLVIVSLFGSVAFGREPGKAVKPAPAEEIARRHFGAGSGLYEQGDYGGALLEFLAAYQAMPRPKLVYNIAKCYHRLEQYPEAVQWYQRYADNEEMANSDPEGVRDAAQQAKEITENFLSGKPAIRTPATPAPVEIGTAPAPPTKGLPPPAPTSPPTPPPLSVPPAAVTPPIYGPEPPPKPATPPWAARHKWALTAVLGGVAGLTLGATGFGLMADALATRDGLNVTCERPCQDPRLGAAYTRYQAGQALAGVGGAVLVLDIAAIVAAVRESRR